MKPPTLVVVLLALLCARPALAAQEAMATALAHFTAAEYEAALDILGGDAAPKDAESDRLRALCLLALNRAADADLIIERVVVARPDYEPSGESSPRVRSAFRAVRARVLPALGRQLYETGKLAFERREFAGAAGYFEQALPILEILALEGRMDMEGLRVLTTDFLYLSRQLIPPPVIEPPPLRARALDAATPLAAEPPRAATFIRAR